MGERLDIDADRARGADIDQRRQKREPAARRRGTAFALWLGKGCEAFWNPDQEDQAGQTEERQTCKPAIRATLRQNPACEGECECKLRRGRNHEEQPGPTFW